MEREHNNNNDDDDDDDDDYDNNDDDDDYCYDDDDDDDDDGYEDDDEEEEDTEKEIYQYWANEIPSDTIRFNYKNCYLTFTTYQAKKKKIAVFRAPRPTLSFCADPTAFFPI